MLMPLILFSVSGAACLAAVLLPGWSDLVLLAGPCALASLFLLARAARRGDGWRRAKPNWILIDGSNVLYWKGGTPQIGTLRDVVGHLTARGFTPGVVFDANAGYLVAGKYQHHAAMGALLGLPEDRVMVVAKGEPADPVLLAAARDLGARIVTNDRYRDWQGAHPEVGEPGHLVRGGFDSNGLWLDLKGSAGG